MPGLKSLNEPQTPAEDEIATPPEPPAEEKTPEERPPPLPSDTEAAPSESEDLPR